MRGRGLKPDSHKGVNPINTVALHAALFTASFFCGELWQFLQAALTRQPSGLIIWLFNFSEASPLCR
jgi:hypothetical protein